MVNKRASRKRSKMAEGDATDSNLPKEKKPREATTKEMEEISENIENPTPEEESEKIKQPKQKKGKKKPAKTQSEITPDSKKSDSEIMSEDNEAPVETSKMDKNSAGCSQDEDGVATADSSDDFQASSSSDAEPKKPLKEKKETLTSKVIADSSLGASDDEFEPKTKGKKKAPKPAKKENLGPKPPNRSILQLKITLRYIEPSIWRRIQVLNNTTFADLHENIKEAMGWLSPAGYHFILSNPKEENSNLLILNDSLDGVTCDFSKEKHLLKSQSTKLSKFLNYKGDHVLYEFDFGESWMHDIVVEKVLPPPPLKADFPKCTGGKRNCPPDEVGGVGGYNHLMEVYKNPQHEEYEELIEDWLKEMNPGWQPEKFNKKSVFRKVKMWAWAPAR